MANHFSVENLWKTLRIFPRKSAAKLCAKNKFFVQLVQNSTFSPFYPHFLTHFYTTTPSLLLINLFHFYTAPTTTTITFFNRKDLIWK